jgi:hypothetical protein
MNRRIFLCLSLFPMNIILADKPIIIKKNNNKKSNNNNQNRNKKKVVKKDPKQDKKVTGIIFISDEGGTQSYKIKADKIYTLSASLEDKVDPVIGKKVTLHATVYEKKIIGIDLIQIQQKKEVSKDTKKKASKK